MAGILYQVEWSSAASAHDMTKKLISDQPQTTYEARSCMFADIRGERVHWLSSLSSSILRAYKLGNHTPVFGESGDL